MPATCLTMITAFVLWCGAPAPTIALGHVPAGAPVRATSSDARSYGIRQPLARGSHASIAIERRVRHPNAGGSTTSRASRQGTVVTTRDTAIETEMLELINAERARAGVSLLRVDPTLDAIAQARSQDMINRHYFSHEIPGGGLVFGILDRDHVAYEMAGENLALNNYIVVYPLARTVRQTNADLMNSSEHRANILEPRYTEIGLGVAFARGSGILILTEVFVQP